MKTQLFRTCATVGFVVAAVMCTAALADSGVHGRVTGRNEDGGFAGAVPAAKIEILSESGASIATTEANAHGYYKINLPPGRYFYKVTAEGYRDEDEGRGLRIDRTEGMLLFHFSLTKGENKADRVKPVRPEHPTGELYGRVMERTEDGDVGIPNAQITFVNQESREVAEVIVSSRKHQDNEIGSYRIVLAAGEWRASVRAKGFERFVETESIQIADGTETEHDFILRRYEPSPEVLAAQGIRGTVMIEKGGRTSPPPFAVQVHVIRTDDRSVVEQTEIAINQSEFEFNLPAGNYRVVASAPDTEFAKAVSAPVFVFPRRFSTARLVMRMKPEEAESGAQPEPSDMPVIEITALNRRDKQPLFNAEIMLRQITDQSATVHRSLTNEKGIATFQVPEGQYFAVARLSGFEVVAASPPDDFARGRLLLDALPKQIAKGTFSMDFHREPTPTETGAIVEVYDGKMGTPLTGATVSLSRGADSPIVQTTDDLGIASFSDATAGTYGLHVSIDGYHDVRRKISHDPLKPRHRVAMYTRPTDVPADTDGLFTVSGAVIFEPEVGFGTALIDGAQLRWTGPATVTTTSGPVGAYSVTIPPGTYSVKVTPPARSDFAPRTFPGISITRDETRNFALLGSTTIPPLSPQVRIHVVDSVTRRPIEGAHVDLQLRGSGGADRVSGTTSSSGQLRLSVSTPGEYLAVASATGYVSQRKEVTLREGIVSVLNMDLQPLDDSTTAKMVDVSGWVVTPKAASRSGRLSSGRDLTLVPASSIPDWTHYDPIPNAAVLWQFPAEGGLPGAMRLVRTDRKGRFTMANLPQQAYTVTVEASGFESLRSRIEVRKGMSDLWLVLNRTDSTSPPDTKPASEKYWLNITVIDQYRKPVAAATIDLFARADQVSGRAVKPFRTGQTNANGQYRTQLSPGNYNVRVSGNQLSTASAIVEILSRDMDQQVQVVRSSSPPETKQPLLRVQIVDETKKPVVGATVTIMQGSQVVRSGKTDKGGYYQLNLSSGTYAVKASGKTINPGGTTVKVASTDVTTIVRVTRTSAPPDTQQATVRIQVIDQTRKGVGGATVTVMLGNRQIQSGTTNALGYYQTQLAPGSYSIKAFGTGINPGGTTIQVGTSNVNAQVSVSRSMTPGDTGDSGGKALSYTAQYLPPGRTSWITIGTYPTRNAAEEAVKLAKIPVKSKTRVIPNQRTISRTRGIMPVRP